MIALSRCLGVYLVALCSAILYDTILNRICMIETTLNLEMYRWLMPEATITEPWPTPFLIGPFFFSSWRRRGFLPQSLQPGLVNHTVVVTMISATEDEPLHGQFRSTSHNHDHVPDKQPINTVLDLPQIYQKPSGTDLIKALALLTLQPRSFALSATDTPKGPAVHPAGVTQYLTSVISSALAWLDTDELREAVWDAAAARLSERSGRTGGFELFC